MSNLTVLNDTAPEARALQIKLLREMPAWRKIAMVGQLSAMTRALALTDIRQCYPEASASDHHRLLADRLLGRDLANQVYGPLPQHLTSTT